MNLPRHFLREYRLLRESRGLRSESAESQSGGMFPGPNHSLDHLRTRKITGKGTSGVDEEICATDSRVVMRRVSTTCTGVMRINAERETIVNAPLQLPAILCFVLAIVVGYFVGRTIGVLDRIGSDRE